MAFIGTFSRALLESATAVYFGGASVSILDAQGNVILGDDLPEAPTVTSTIADRTYVVGDAAVTVDLRTKFDGATSYAVSPANSAVTIDGYTLTISPAATMTSTTFTVRGINGGGSSDPLTFKLTITAPVPELLQPLPDQSLLIGGGTVTLPLAEYFSGAAGYAVSPANSGVTISNGNLVISRTTARDVIITVTATNATGQDTSDSFALLVAAPANQAPVASAIPQQNPTANTAFTVDLSSYFVDPEGASLSFDYTGTLPTGITRNGAVFSGTATVSGQTASGVLRARDPGNLEAEAPVTWAVAAQPTLQATITPDPLVAGQQASITFNAAIDGPPTIAQGQTAITATRVGTTNEWAFTPVSSGALIIAATAAGYASSPWTFDVQPALPALGTLSDNTARIENVTPTTAPFDLEIVTPARYAGQRTVTPSEFSGGPVAHVPPTFTGTADVGQALTGDLGLWLTLANDMNLEPVWVRRLTANSGDEFVPISGATGTTYTVASSDQGYTIRFGGQAEDANGDRLVLSEAQAVIPAAVGWYAPTWKRNGETASRGTITGPDANGDLTIGSDGVAGGNTQGNPRVYFDVVPGDTYELETHIEWGDATRVIGRLSDMTSYNTAIHVSVFDVTKPEGATTLSRTDTFTPAGTHVAMYYIFTMGVSGTAKILSNTRARQIA
ncbi:hypothetical protein PARHAE_00770 [Paracoccus haematequi]|uniref:Uncharacterized protein n=1 Tax=Paracoccus haematequi TaxID=2491866 RepID=A0A3S4DUK5_9RHOB|nr:hypothetical protein [Paracoccus haematequi]VDS07593.1 hypothetical protein PARHAE_00770 [Paracoccus haematequi]